MTVTYSSEVASSSRFGIFWKLLFRWKGSVYKIIWPEMIVYTVMYAILSLVYRFALTQEQNEIFEQLVIYCRSFVNSVPLTFVLGFYVSLVVQRWWDQYQSLPWPDNLAILVASSIKGSDVRTRMMKRAVVRYINLAFTLTLRAISTTIEKRFQNFDHLIDEGFLLDTEKDLLEDADREANGSTYWLPIVWAVAIVERAKAEGLITNDLAVKVVIKELNYFRGKCGRLLSYNRMSIPLVYTQVVTIAVYSFLIANIVGRQFIPNDTGQKGSGTLDLYIPIFSYFQVLFYLGWLKVAESLINPFGKDDEDFDVDSLVDRNLKISYLIADKVHDSHPELKCDKHWEEVFQKQASLRTSCKSDGANGDKGYTEAELRAKDAKICLFPSCNDD